MIHFSPPAATNECRKRKEKAPKPAGLAHRRGRRPHPTKGKSHSGSSEPARCARVAGRCRRQPEVARSKAKPAPTTPARRLFERGDYAAARRALTDQDSPALRGALALDMARVWTGVACAAGLIIIEVVTHLLQPS